MYTFFRVMWSKMSIYRTINDVGRYSSLEHKPAVANPQRFICLHQSIQISIYLSIITNVILFILKICYKFCFIKTVLLFFRHEIVSKGKEHMWKDGLNTLKYETLQKTNKKLYIHVSVKISK